MTFNKEEWLYWGRWVQPTISGSYWDDWSQGSTFPFELEGITGKLPVLDGHFFLWREDFDKIAEFLKEHEGNHELLQTFEQWVDDIHERCRRDISRAFPDTKSHLLALKARYNDVGNPWCFFGYFVDKWLAQRVPELTEEYEAFVASVNPLKEPLVVQQKNEANALRRKAGYISHISELPVDVQREVIAHVQRFRFCGVHHFVGEPYRAEKLFWEHGMEQQKPEETTIPEEVIWHHKLACLAAWARTYMAETSGMLAHAFKPHLQAAEYELGLGWSDILWLHIDEILQGLEDPHGFVKPDLQERKKKVGLFNRENTVVIVGGEDVNPLLESIYTREDAKLPLRGRPGSKGKARGDVKVIIEPEDIHKVKKGDILVANETAPDFMPAMRLAAAIVTDVGGITSHAAIVSRELGIPCIVDTKHATHLLKDGQEVVVDADEGVVNLTEVRHGAN